jgi:hypothetical protein
MLAGLVVVEHTTIKAEWLSEWDFLLGFFFVVGGWLEAEVAIDVGHVSTKVDLVVLVVVDDAC